MRRQTTRRNNNNMTHLLLLSFLGFGIAITLLNLFSIKPSLLNIQFYLILLLVLSFLYRPLGLFLITKISTTIRHIARFFYKTKVRKLYKLEKKRINQLNCIEVVQFLKPIFKRQGYEIQLLKGSKEREADLILRKGLKTYVVQTKRMATRVGPNVIHEVLDVVSKHNANGAIIITNQYYTSSAKKLAKKSNIKLINRDELKKMLKTTNKKYRFATALSFILNK